MATQRLGNLVVRVMYHNDVGYLKVSNYSHGKHFSEGTIVLLKRRTFDNQYRKMKSISSCPVLATIAQCLGSRDI